MEQEKFKNINVSDCIEYFGANEILDKIRDEDIVSRIDSFILTRVNDDALFDAIYDKDRFLDSFTINEIKEYLTDMGYDVMDTLEEKDEILRKIKTICRELQPKGYIGKEDAKKIMCEYIDTWMNRSC